MPGFDLRVECGCLRGARGTNLARITGAAHAVACVNGMSALQTALVVAGVKPGDLVITQALTFVATANAIRHAGADPVFLDVSHDTCGLDPAAVERFLRGLPPGRERRRHPPRRASNRRLRPHAHLWALR